MFKYVVKRVIAAIITLWALVTIVFFLVRLMPGDPFTSAKLTKEVAANMRSYYGFDKPLIQQYFTYLANLLHGNFGYSMKYTNKTVNYIIGQTFPYSADLGIRALVMAVSFGLVLGIIAARNRGKKLDFFCVIIAIIGTSIPDFIMGAILQYFSGIQIHYSSGNRPGVLHAGLCVTNYAIQYVGSNIAGLYKDSSFKRIV